LRKGRRHDVLRACICLLLLLVPLQNHSFGL
jgi:hypothetical protein